MRKAVRAQKRRPFPAQAFHTRTAKAAVIGLPFWPVCPSARPQRSEKFPQEGGTFLSQHAGRNRRMMVIRQGKEVDERPARSCLRIRRSIDHARNPGINGRSRAHGARLQRDIQHTLPQPPAAQRAAGILDGFQLRVCERGFVPLSPVSSPPDDFTRTHHHGAHRDFSFCCRLTSQRHRLAHKAFVLSGG